MYMVLKFISPELWPHLTTRVVLTFTVISQCVIWLKETLIWSVPVKLSAQLNMLVSTVVADGRKCQSMQV